MTNSHGQRARMQMKRRGHALNFFKFSADDESMSVQDQLKKALSRQHTHVIELFREFDSSEDGNISARNSREEYDVWDTMETRRLWKLCSNRGISTAPAPSRS